MIYLSKSNISKVVYRKKEIDLEKLTDTYMAIKLEGEYEHILIGSLFGIRMYLQNNDTTELIYHSKNQLEFLLENVTVDSYYFNTLHSFIGDCNEPVLENEFDYLTNSENPLYLYAGLKLYEIYREHKKKKELKFPLNLLQPKTEEPYLLDQLEDITLPFRFSVKKTLDKLFDLEGFIANNPLHLLENDFFKHQSQNLYINDGNDIDHYVISNYSLMPLIVHYLKCIYIDQNMFFRRCKVCNKLFVARHRNTTLCSEACQKEQQKENKKQFKEREKQNADAAAIAIEKSSSAALAHWYYTIKKLKDNNTDELILQKIDLTFKDFKKELSAMKKKAKTGKISKEEFSHWCSVNQYKIDELLPKH